MQSTLNLAQIIIGRINFSTRLHSCRFTNNKKIPDNYNECQIIIILILITIIYLDHSFQFVHAVLVILLIDMLY